MNTPIDPAAPAYPVSEIVYPTGHPNHLDTGVRSEETYTAQHLGIPTRLKLAAELGAGLLRKVGYNVTAADKHLFATDALALADALIDAHNAPTPYLATRIADDLLTNGGGQKAERLDMVAEDQCSIGGWSREALIQRISKILNQ